LLDEDQELKAYLNIIELNTLSDGDLQMNYGIGNVCVDKANEKKGLGLLIMQIASNFLKQNDAQGLLLCKKNLIAFYKKANWIEFEGTFTIEGKNIDASLLSLKSIFNEKIVIDKTF
jgi:predicted GNAT family N-acyltransferase